MQKRLHASFGRLAVLELLPQRAERVLHRHVGADAVGVFGHPLRDLRRGGIATGRREPHGVALGQDADGDISAVNDHQTPDRSLMHPLRGLKRALGRGHDLHVRRGPQLARRRPFLGDYREV